MATTLSDKNKKSVFSTLPTKGFRTKFWREYRSSACKGSGVGKDMDRLEKLGVPASGDPSKADIGNMREISETYTSLLNSMLKAKGKCGKLQSQTEEMIEIYRKLTRTYLGQSEKLFQNADKIRQAKMAQQLKVEKENEETDKYLDKLKAENEQKKKLIIKELKSVGERAGKIENACKVILKDAKSALKEVETILAAFNKQVKEPGADVPGIEAKCDTLLRAVPKKYNIAVHVKNTQAALPKLFKEATDMLSQYFKVEYVSDERVAVARKLKAAQVRMQEADKDVKFFATQHRIALEHVQMSRSEGA